MKGNKCFGLLLLFSIIFGLSLSVSSDTNALKHEYDGIITSIYRLPNPVIDYNENTVSIPSQYTNDSTSYTFPFGNALEVGVIGSAWSNSYESIIKPKFNSSYFICNSSSSGSTCKISSVYGEFSRAEIEGKSGYEYYYSLPNVSISSYIPSSSTVTGFRSRQPETFDSMGLTPDLGSTFYCNNPFRDGCIHASGLSPHSISNYFNDNASPYWYGADGFYVHSSAINPDNGIRYNHTFSLSDLYTFDFPSFSKLRIPLISNNDYFRNPDNLHSGRELSWYGTFEFDGDFVWNESALSSGKFEIYVENAVVADYNENTDDDAFKDIEIPCTTNLITVESLTRLEFTCDYTLTRDYLVFQPSLYIVGANEWNNSYKYVWTTNDKWRFASMFLTTDNDDTQGSSFNTTISGGGTKAGDASNDFDTSGDWFTNLVNLFAFNFTNPFAPIFYMFTNQEQCASIPVLSSMLHSEETQVCPFFSTQTRQVLTPVLSLASAMLVFGFAVRWLGASSGNLFEDSGHISPPGGYTADVRGRNVKPRGWRRSK